MMKITFGFLMGTTIFFVSFFWAYPNYSDYRAAAETSEWLVQIQSIQDAIEEYVLEKGSVLELGSDFDREVFQFHSMNLDVFEITKHGEIILRGGGDGQVVILIPSLDRTRIIWRCIGGSRRAVPSRCKNDS